MDGLCSDLGPTSKGCDRIRVERVLGIKILNIFEDDVSVQPNLRASGIGQILLLWFASSFDREDFYSKFVNF